MRIADRIEQHRQIAKTRRVENPIGNALVEVFGFEGHKAAYERCLSSLRFPALCSLAANLRDYPKLWPQVVVLAKTLADNPKSRSHAYRKVTPMTCPHDNISLPTTSDPDIVCADCGAVLKPDEIFRIDC